MGLRGHLSWQGAWFTSIKTPVWAQEAKWISGHSSTHSWLRGGEWKYKDPWGSLGFPGLLAYPKYELLVDGTWGTNWSLSFSLHIQVHTRTCAHTHTWICAHIYNDSHNLWETETLTVSPQRGSGLEIPEVAFPANSARTQYGPPRPLVPGCTTKWKASRK